MLFRSEEHVPTDLALIGVYNFTNRKVFNKCLESGMKKPTHKGEYQIAALLEAYMKIEGPMQLMDTSEWYDCGELNTYHQSKARLMSKTARSFNQISVDTFFGTVTKSSSDLTKSEKIKAEKNWYRNLDEEQSLFCPRVLESPAGTLRMTLEPGTALNEVLVYDNLRTDVWHEIIRKILKIHHNVFQTQTEETANHDDSAKYCFDHYFITTRNRLDEISKYVPIRKKHTRFLLDVALTLSASPVWSQVIHGDSHLGNIIYDPHSGSIKFVDPRGVFGNTWTQGDIRYDMGKLLQDFYCGYSMILAGRYSWKSEEEVEICWVPGTEGLSNFLESELKSHGYDVELLKKLAVLLLITAIPFHTEDSDRQKAMFARGNQLINSFTINN